MELFFMLAFGLFFLWAIPAALWRGNETEDEE